MKNFLYLFLFVLTISFIGNGCQKPEGTEKNTITVIGSDTMVNLSQKWAEVYMEKNENVAVQVNGGGSGNGIASLLNGTTEIANASRELKKKEYENAKSKGITPNEIKVALDGIAIIVSNNNKVKDLTLEQLKNIFSGKIKNWKEVGGADLNIVLYGRENSSGTYEFFKDHVLGKDNTGRPVDFANETQVLQGTAALGEAVARDNKGIGYGGVGYFAHRDDVKILPIKKDENSEAIAPAENKKVNYDAIWDGSYSISRYLYCYTNGEPQGEVKEFIDFITSAEGQKLVEEMEYIPLPKDMISKEN